MAVSQLGYVGMSVSRIEAWEQFSKEVLGLEVSERRSDGALYLRMDDHHYRFLIEAGGADDMAYVGWELPDALSLEGLATKLEASGISIRQGSEEEKEKRKVRDLVHLQDPNGIEIELFYGPLLSERPFHPSRPISGFRTGPLGLGHVVLTARDFERTISFYRDVLGFRISDYIRMQRPGIGQVTLVFFHCNPRHHSLAFSSASLGPKRISHFMIELNSIDDVGSTYYLCQEKKLPIVMSLGRHINDQMLSFYVQSPSGFGIEYGWGGRLVDDATWAVQQYRTGSVWGHWRAQA
jgi:2,3-dihydroxybiphenyl 1,2-dioxygenase